MEKSEIRRLQLLNVFLWLAQILLAGLFFMASFMKLTTPIPELSKSLNWVDDIPEGLVRFIGISELTGAIGLLLPSVLRIRPILTPCAALGFMTLMILAMLFHISRAEYHMILINMSIALIASFIAWGRFKKLPIKRKVDSDTIPTAIATE